MADDADYAHHPPGGTAYNATSRGPSRSQLNSDDDAIARGRDRRTRAGTYPDAPMINQNTYDDADPALPTPTRG